MKNGVAKRAILQNQITPTFFDILSQYNSII